MKCWGAGMIWRPTRVRNFISDSLHLWSCRHWCVHNICEVFFHPTAAAYNPFIGPYCDDGFIAMLQCKNINTLSQYNYVSMPANSLSRILCSGWEHRQSRSNDRYYSVQQYWSIQNYILRGIYTYVPQNAIPCNGKPHQGIEYIIERRRRQGDIRDEDFRHDVYPSTNLYSWTHIRPGLWWDVTQKCP